MRAKSAPPPPPGPRRPNKANGSGMLVGESQTISKESHEMAVTGGCPMLSLSIKFYSLHSQ